MKRVSFVAAVVVALGIAGAEWRGVSASRMSRPDRRAQNYHHLAAGGAAYWDATWRIAPQAKPTGLIVGAAVCDDEAFLLDRQLAVVHRVDLARGSIVADLGEAGAGSSGLHEVDGLAADCRQRTLFVVDHGGVAVIDMDSGRTAARFARPVAFVNAMAPPVLDRAANALYVSGLWPAAESDWLSKPIDRMFEGDRVGYRVALDTGRTTPMMPALERGCWSLGPNCLSAMLDAVAGSPGAAFVAAHKVGTSVGVYDEAFRLLRTIDVRSPLFLESGSRNGSRDLAAMVSWNEDNSVIRECFAIGGRIVTIHSVNRTRGWKPGQQTNFDVFMNVHTLDGAGVASDVRLPDLPVGHDASSVYVIDYGQTGRRRIGAGSMTLTRIPVERQ